MKTISVQIKNHEYPIYIGNDLLSQFDLIKPHVKGHQVFVVTNETVAPLYLQRLVDALKDVQIDTLVLPDGEQYKNLPVLAQVFDALLDKRHQRTTTLIALGGGVIGDLTGFAAACYQRGVNFIQVPTTLLAQVDASVGGKTAVNHPLGKNMIGAFHQPRCVIADLTTLTTLPDREFRAGLAEVIKHAVIYDSAFFDWLDEHMSDLLNKQDAALAAVVSKCCEIKADVVSQDEKEQGVRAILNFGHTAGHAVEHVLGYGEWLHGEAVALGMVVAARLSVSYGSIEQTVADRIQALIVQAGLPVIAPEGLSMTQCLDAMRLDKKAASDKLTWIILTGMGQAAVVDDISDESVTQALQSVGFQR